MPAPPLDGNHLTIQLWIPCSKHRRAITWPALKSSLLEHSRAAGGLGQHFCSNGPGLRTAWKLQHEMPQCPPENSARWSRADPAPKKGSVKESNQLPRKARNEQQPKDNSWHAAVLNTMQRTNSYHLQAYSAPHVYSSPLLVQGGAPSASPSCPSLPGLHKVG